MLFYSLLLDPLKTPLLLILLILIGHLFYRQFTLHQKNNLEEIQKQFILEYGIEYLLLEPHAELPSSIKPLVKETFFDKISKLSVFTLNVKK